jgi:hypothetical protein
MRTLSSVPAAAFIAPLSAASLRRELNRRALDRAARLGLRYELTIGREPSVVFAADERYGHGNFDPASFAALSGRPEWSRRLAKAHSGSRRAMPRADWRWRELDCACSSDALLMNIFCHPEVAGSRRVAALLGVDRGAEPSFGVKPRLPLHSGLVDATEVDMQLRSLLVEAKLTESNFQTARPALVLRFRDLEEVFAVGLLPRTRSFVVDQRWDDEQAAWVAVERGSTGNFASYQLIRGALAAHATGASFAF